MTHSAISGTILAVQHDSEHTILCVATGGNGSKRQDNVVLPGRRDSITSGKAVKLINFVRDKDGSLVPGEKARLTISNLGRSEKIQPEEKPQATQHEPDQSLEHPETPLVPAPAKPAAVKQAKSAPGIMAFSDKTTRKAVFNRAVEVAREFAEHIRKSGQIIKIQGRDYVTVAGWALLPAFESANCYTVSHQVHPDGTVIAEAIVEKDGAMVSRGFGACSEKDRPKINDRLAMAQTRARGSALKARYSVLVTLAGYEASLADEVEVVVDTPAPTHVINRPQPSTQPSIEPKPSKMQIDFALKMFDGNAKALLAEAANHGLLVFQVEDISTPILKKIVEKRINERKQQRAEQAANVD